MKNIITAGIVALVVALAVVYLVGGNQSGSVLGGAYRLPNSDLSAKSITSTGDFVVNGGTATITTSNSATSTLIAGCVQTYATSTETPIKIQATTSAAAGVVLLSLFGTCPNL